MGLGGISIWQLLIILAIVVMLFGTRRLRGLGSDLGAAIKGFRSSLNDDTEASPDSEVTPPRSEETTATRPAKDDPTPPQTKP